MYIFIGREGEKGRDIYFKKLAYAIIGAGKSENPKTNQQAGDKLSIGVAVLTPNCIGYQARNWGRVSMLQSWEELFQGT